MNASDEKETQNPLELDFNAIIPLASSSSSNNEYLMNVAEVDDFIMAKSDAEVFDWGKELFKEVSIFCRCWRTADPNLY